jgi:NAD(P)-dependent dehydrogenase (short-subunit alcohol dehydrogenase family)
MARFDRKRALVSGGTRGIGYAISTALAREGAQVVMGYRNQRDAAQRALASLPGRGHAVLQADIAEPEQCQQLVAAAIAHLGGLDLLINNAGISILHPFGQVDFEAWRDAFERTLDANLLGPACLAFAAAEHMARHGGGRIVAVGSRGAFRGEPIKPAYGASKAGLHALHQSLAQALAPHRIFVGVVAPGFVSTELSANRLAGPEGDGIRAQSPLNRVALPEEVARAVLFLAEPGTEFLTGTIIDVNGASYLRG